MSNPYMREDGTVLDAYGNPTSTTQPLWSGEKTESPLPEDFDIRNLPTREWEVFTHVIAYADWQECQHGKKIVTVRAHWSDDSPRKTTVYPDGYSPPNHTQWFSRTVHLDGSVEWIEQTDYQTGEKYMTHNTTEFGQHHKCPKCGSIDTHKVEYLPYGNLTTCSAEGCDYQSYYDIGD